MKTRVYAITLIVVIIILLMSVSVYVSAFVQIPVKPEGRLPASSQNADDDSSQPNKITEVIPDETVAVIKKMTEQEATDAGYNINRKHTKDKIYESMKQGAFEVEEPVDESGEGFAEKKPEQNFLQKLVALFVPEVAEESPSPFETNTETGTIEIKESFIDKIFKFFR